MNNRTEGSTKISKRSSAGASHKIGRDKETNFTKICRAQVYFKIGRHVTNKILGSPIPGNGFAAHAYLPPGVVGGCCVVPFAAPSTPVPERAAFCFSIVQSKV